MQGTPLQSLTQEDPTFHGATKPLCHNYWARPLEPKNHNYWSHVLQLLKPAHPRACALQQEKPPQWEAHAPQLENSPCSRQLRESPHAATKTHHSQKTIRNLQKRKRAVRFQILGCIFVTEFCIALWKPLCCCLFLANCHMLIDMSHVDSPCPLTDIPKLHGKCGFNSAPSSHQRIWKPTLSFSSTVHNLALPSLISHFSNCCHPMF